ncbi:protein NO VEIN domain-containing protein [Aliarcobacter butzleri]
MARFLLTNDKMFDTKHNNLVYDEFLKFKEAFFEKGVSFFDPNIKLFDTNEVFEEFEKRIIKNYDDSKLKSVSKYLKQLKNSSKKVRHFFACIAWLYNYPIHDKKNSTKTYEIKEYLGEYYKDSLDNTVFKYSGIANYGLLSQYIYYDINFIYFFTRQYITLKNNPHDIINSIDLYTLMKEISIEDFKNMQKLSSRHMLNYLFNPDTYEPIVDTSCKENIVKHYLGKVNKNTLDEDILSIRKNQIGFEISLFDICKKSGISKTAYVLELELEEKKDGYIVSTSSKNYKDDDLLDKYKKQIENGLNAELLVYNEIEKDVDRTILLNQLVKNIGSEKIDDIHDKLEQLIHYSKNFDKYAPFDLLSTRGQELVYIEVKSTIGNEIYFSKSELEFAYDHIENYLVKVVKDGVIYDFSIYEILCEYFEYKEKINLWLVDTIKVKISFNSAL